MEDLKKEPKNIIGINTSNISKVKSFYIVKEIFSYLDEKTKLDIIKYSKKLQDKFEIDIEDYIEKSGRYKTGERNGQGKEYLLNTNLLIFEGEYLNNKRHGLGEEYDYNGNLIYKGGYLNGKRHGNGEEYDPYDGALIIKGEYKNGKLWNGKGFNHVKAKIENGNGKIESYITFDDYLDKNIKFEGQYINGEISGKGKEYYGDKLIFEGEYLKGKKWNGKGYNNLELDLKNGNGKFKFYYEHGKINYEGKYINGIIQGYCKRNDEYGNLVFEGNVYDGKANGKGREYLNGYNVKYEGEYLNGEWHGKGREYNNKGKIIFIGEYLNGNRDKGKEYNNKGKIIFIGEYLNGNRHKGKEYNRFCKVKFIGEYDEEGKRRYGEKY